MIVVAVVLLATGGLLVTRQSAGPETDRPNIVLVSFESTPAYKLPCYGYTRNTTPHLCSFAHSATLYERAYTPGSFTALALSGVATGKYPYRVGVTDEYSKIPDKERTLAERLQDAGYSTYSMGYEGIPVYNHMQGFQTVLKAVPKRNHILRALAQEEGPVFVRVHIWGSHGGYDPNRIQSMERKWLQNYTLQYIDTVNTSRRTDAATSWDGYDEQLRVTDSARIRRVLQQVKASGEFDDSLVAVFSDHGELLRYADGRRGHEVPGYSDHLFRVPLILKYPEQRRGERVDRLVSTLDLYATALDAAGVQYDDTTLNSRSLTQAPGHDTVIVTALQKGVAAVTPQHKLYRCDTANRAPGCGQGVDYVLRRHNGTHWRPATNHTMAQQLQQRIQQYLDQVKNTSLTDDRRIQMQERLRELGYID